MKPTRRDVMEWALRSGYDLAGIDGFVREMSSRQLFTKFAKLAYAAGRKAGMEEAVRECEAHEQNAVAHSEEERYMAHVLAQAIRAAMGADK